MVEFQGKFDESKTKNMNNQTFKKLWWLFLLVSVLCVCLGVVGILVREDESDLAYGITLIVLGVLFTPFVLLGTALAQKNLNKSMHILSPDTTETYQFYPDRLIITQRKQKSGEEVEYEAVTNTRYSYLFKVEETRDRYFLRISKAQAHIVNKSDLTQGTIEELNAILTEKLGVKFKKMN